MSLTASRLEHAYAFDAAEWPSDGLLLAVVSTPEFVDLTLARAVSGVTFLCEGDDTLTHAKKRLEQGYLTERARMLSSAEAAHGAQTTSASHRAAIWAAPQSSVWGTRLTTIEHALEAKGVLSVLAATQAGVAL